MEVRCPRMTEHVGAEVTDAGAGLEALEELADRVAGEGASVAVGEQRIVRLRRADAVIVDVRIERLQGLDRDGDVAGMDRLARDGADVEPPLRGGEIHKAKADELLAAKAAAEERPNERRVAAALLASSDARSMRSHISGSLRALRTSSFTLGIRTARIVDSPCSWWILRSARNRATERSATQALRAH